MALRFKVIDLGGYPAGQPVALTLDCAYWKLRMHQIEVGTVTMDGVPVDAFGTDYGIGGTLTVILDFPPVFDGRGAVVPWNQVVYFNGDLRGCSVVLVYDDPGLARTPH